MVALLIAQNELGSLSAGGTLSKLPRDLTEPKDALPVRQRRLAAAKGIERRVALFAHLHVNKEAAPEMYRLPIQTGEILPLA
jgi:hypothetical protein